MGHRRTELTGVDGVDVLRPVVRPPPHERLVSRRSRLIGDAHGGNTRIREDNGDIAGVRRGAALGLPIRGDDVDRAVGSNPHVHGNIVVASARKELFLVLSRREQAHAPVDVRGRATIHNLARVAMRRPVAARVAPESERDEPRVRPVPVGSLEEGFVEHAVEPRIKGGPVDLPLRHRVEVRARCREAVRSSGLDSSSAVRAGAGAPAAGGAVVSAVVGQCGHDDGVLDDVVDLRRIEAGTLQSRAQLSFVLDGAVVDLDDDLRDARIVQVNVAARGAGSRRGGRRVSAGRRTAVVVIERVVEHEPHNEDEDGGGRDSGQPEEPVHVASVAGGAVRRRAGALPPVRLPFGDDVMHLLRRMGAAVGLRHLLHVVAHGEEVLRVVDPVVGSDLAKQIFVFVRVEGFHLGYDVLVEHGVARLATAGRATQVGAPPRRVGLAARTAVIAVAVGVRESEARHGFRSFTPDPRRDVPVDVVKEESSSNIRIDTERPRYALKLGTSAPLLIHVASQLFPVQLEPPLACSSASKNEFPNLRDTDSPFEANLSVSSGRFVLKGRLGFAQICLLDFRFGAV